MSEASSERDPAPGAGRPTVALVADDNDVTRSLYAMWLRSAGYDVVEATDGEEAVLAILDHRPGLVVCDVRMPGRSGYEVTRGQLPAELGLTTRGDVPIASPDPASPQPRKAVMRIGKEEPAIVVEPVQEPVRRPATPTPEPAIVPQPA